MMEPVTTILVQRSRHETGLERTLTVSAAVHVSVLVLLIVFPDALGSLSHAAPEPMPMSISIGGSEGPRTGVTQVGGRAIQERAETHPAKPEPIRPPAPKPPEMTLPTPAAKVPAKPAKPVPATKPAPDATRTAKPTTGPEVRAGSTKVETGATGQGLGLSSGGGGGTGGYLDVGNFCCPEYLVTMLDLIRRNWDQNQAAAGEALVKFTIVRDGRITAVQVERSSGNGTLDLTAQRALLVTRQLPALPQQFTEPQLTVHLNFQYQR